MNWGSYLFLAVCACAACLGSEENVDQKPTTLTSVSATEGHPSLSEASVADEAQLHQQLHQQAQGTIQQVAGGTHLIQKIPAMQDVEEEPAMQDELCNAFLKGAASCEVKGGRRRTTRRRRRKKKPKKKLTKEEDEKLTAEINLQNGSFDWSQCVSEGGDEDCALCDTSDGALPCSLVTKGAASTECTDDTMFNDLRFWKFKSMYPKTDGRRAGSCVMYDGSDRDRDDRVQEVKEGQTSSAWKFPTLGDSLILTKAFVIHPAGTAAGVGVLLFKRIVTHLCTGKGKACTKGTTVADVYKAGMCFKCTGLSFSCERNEAVEAWQKCKDRGDTKKVQKCKSVKSNKAVEAWQKCKLRADRGYLKEKFVRECVAEAFKTSGEIKDKYMCTGTDEKLAETTIISF